jgi:DNA-binding transcriptional regulator YdaS (Cro superfamily)
MALAFEQTGKYVSEQHESARRRGLLTAGEVAAKIRKATGRQVSAKDLRPYADEWHHSGFYAGKMGKTWFFRPNTIEFLITKF